MFRLAVFMLLVVTAGSATAQNRCAGTKIKAAGKKASCLLGLEAKEAKGGVAPPADKVAKCMAKLLSTFVKAEAKGGCFTTGDANAVEDKVDMFVDDVDMELGLGGVNGCQATKLKAAGKKAKCRLGLEAKEAAKGVPPAADKVAKCNAKLASSFMKAETRGGCASTGDAADIEAKVDMFVDDVGDELNGMPTTTTTTTSTTTTTVPPLCCALSSPQVCGYPPSAQVCMEVGGTVGLPGQVCDGATGACQATAGAGPCCDLMEVSCLGGPDAEAACTVSEGTFFGSGICNPSSNCSPP